MYRVKIVGIISAPGCNVAGSPDKAIAAADETRIGSSFYRIL
jgi:hypothetical protein